MTPLQAALAVTQHHQATVLIAQHLHLEVSRSPDELLGVQPTVPECRLGLRPAARQGLLDLVGVVHLSHAPSTTSGDGLYHHRCALAQGFQEGLGKGEIEIALASGQHRHSQAPSQRACARLVAQQLKGRGRGPHESHAALGRQRGKGGVFGQEAVTRVQQGAALVHGDGELLFPVEISAHAVALETTGLVGHAQVQAARVVACVNGHRAQSELRSRTRNPQRHLPPVGYKY